MESQKTKERILGIVEAYFENYAKQNAEGAEYAAERLDELAFELKREAQQMRDEQAAYFLKLAKAAK